MVRALETNGLVSKTALFKRRLDRGAWAFYYKTTGENLMAFIIRDNEIVAIPNMPPASA